MRSLSRMDMIIRVGIAAALAWGVVVPAASPNVAAAASTTGTAIATPVVVQLDGKPLTLAVKPLEQTGGTVMLPAKALFDALKMKSTFKGTQFTVYRGSVAIRGTVGKPILVIGGKTVSIAVPPLLVSGRIYLSLRVAAQIMDKPVAYSAKTRLVEFGVTAAGRLAMLRSLYDAAVAGDATAIKSLLERGVDPNVKIPDRYGDNLPIDYAVIYNKTEAVRALIQGGAKIALAGQNLGYLTVLAQNAELMEILLQAGLNPNGSTGGSTLLELASSTIGKNDNGTPIGELKPLPEMVDVLLKYGANPKLDNSLTDAVYSMSYPVIQSLLRAGADPFKMNANGVTAYELAQSYQLTRWMTIQPERVAIQPIVFKLPDGSTLQSGTVNLRLTDDRAMPVPSITWTQGTAYADLPPGTYRIQDVETYGVTYMSPPSATITIGTGAEGSGELQPIVVQLPETVMTVELATDRADIRIDGGSVGMRENNVNSSYYAFTEVVGHSFKLYAPPGSYVIDVYHSRDNGSYGTEAPFTVTADGTGQKATVKIVPPLKDRLKP